MEISKCKFCESPLNNSPEESDDDTYNLDCPVCGYYKITREACYDYNGSNIPNEDKILFCGHIRNNSSKKAPILIDSNIVDKISEIVLPYTRLTVTEKINNVLKYIGDHSKSLTDFVDVNLLEFPRFYVLKLDDLATIIRYLHERKYIRMQDKTDCYPCLLTIEGWGKYEKLKEININSKKVFVAFKFKTDFADNLFKTIQSACFKCKEFNAVKSDPLQHNEQICDRIIADIKESRFIVADFTGQNQGVYYEAGYAMGLGIPVIRTCRKDEVDSKKLHFDTRQYPHIPWENMPDLEKQLIAKIKNII